MSKTTLARFETDLSLAANQSVQALQQQQLDHLQTTLRTIETNSSELHETIQTEIEQQLMTEALRIVTHMNDVCPDGIRFGEFGSLGFAILFAIFLLAFIVVTICDTCSVACCRTVICGVGFIVWLLAVTLATAIFILLVAGSDFCLDAHPVLLKYVDSPMTDYYLDCPTSQSPASPQIDQLLERASNSCAESRTGVIELDHDVGSIIHRCCESDESYTCSSNRTAFCTLLRDIQAPALNGTITAKSNTNGSITLSDQIHQICESIDAAKGNVSCNRLTPQINHALSAICTTLYDGLAFFLLNALILVAAFYLLLVATIWHIHRAKLFDEIDDGDEPSAPPSARIEMTWRQRRRLQEARSARVTTTAVSRKATTML